MSNDMIISNFEKFTKILLRCEKRHGDLERFLEKYADRILITPGHDKSDRASAMSGGMVSRCLSVLGHARTLMTTSAFADCNFSMESIIIVCLLFDIGRIGDEKGEYYIEQTSQWHKEKGMLYTYNPNIRRMSQVHRGLYLLQSEGIILTQDEWIAILTHQGPSNEENKFYINFEPKLAILLQMAVKLAQMQDFQGTENN